MKPQLIPTFTQNDIQIDIEQFLAVKAPQMIKALNFIGIEIVTEARKKTKLVAFPLVYPHSKDGFYDITGNLRGSIGYLLTNNNRTLKKNFEGETEGINKGLALAKKVSSQYSGYVLTVVAGMEYAVYVESKGYDVISSSLPLKSYVESKLKQLTGAQ